MLINFLKALQLQGGIKALDELYGKTEPPIPYDERIEVFRTLMNTSSMYPEYPKALTTYHQLSDGYIIEIPQTQDVKKAKLFVKSIEQPFICGNAFVTIPQRTVDKVISVSGTFLIILFAILFSFVMSAPTVVSLKVLSGVQYLVNRFRRKDETKQEETEIVTQERSGKEYQTLNEDEDATSEEFSITCTKVYSYVSFVVLLVVSFFMFDVILSNSHYISVLMPYERDDCFSVYPDKTMLDGLFNDENASNTNYSSNRVIIKKLLKVLGGENGEDELDDLLPPAQVWSEPPKEQEGNETVFRMIEMESACGGAIWNTNAKVKWKVQTPYETKCQQGGIGKFWARLATKSYHYCGSSDWNDPGNIIDGETYDHSFYGHSESLEWGDGCYWYKSNGRWYIYGKIIDRPVSECYRTKLADELTLIRESTYNGPRSETFHPYWSEILNDYDTGPRMWMNGIYQYRWNDYIKDNDIGYFEGRGDGEYKACNYNCSENIRNLQPDRQKMIRRWCLIPEAPQKDDEGMSESTEPTRKLMEELSDPRKNLHWFIKSFPAEEDVRTEHGWERASRCSNGRLTNMHQCTVRLRLNTSENWEEFLPSCDEVRVYQSGPAVYFYTNQTDWCGIKVTNSQLFGQYVQLRITLGQPDFQYGTTHCNCRTMPGSNLARKCDIYAIDDFSPVYPETVQGESFVTVEDLGSEYKKLDLFGDFFNFGLDLEIIIIVIVCGVGGFILIKYVLPCVCKQLKKKKGKTKQAISLPTINQND